MVTICPVKYFSYALAITRKHFHNIVFLDVCTFSVLSLKYEVWKWSLYLRGLANAFFNGNVTQSSHKICFFPVLYLSSKSILFYKIILPLNSLCFLSFLQPWLLCVCSAVSITTQIFHSSIYVFILSLSSIGFKMSVLSLHQFGCGLPQ